MCHDRLKTASSRSNRQIARERNQRGVDPMRPTHARGKQSSRKAIAACVTEGDIDVGPC